MKRIPSLGKLLVGSNLLLGASLPPTAVSFRLATATSSNGSTSHAKRAMTTSLGATDASGGESHDPAHASLSSAALAALAGYHPVVVEGMGSYDPRDPANVAARVVAGIRRHHAQHPPTRPLLVVTQGDPREARGISAVTPLVAAALSGGRRGLVCLDEAIDPSHTAHADRSGVIHEVHYSQLVRVLEEHDDSVVPTLTAAIDAHIVAQNEGRARTGKPPVQDYFRTYALLQEVTKAGLKRLCGGELTVCHTSAEIHPFSVTSFGTVGLDLGLYHPKTDLAAYDAREPEAPVDFASVDPR